MTEPVHAPAVRLSGHSAIDRTVSERDHAWHATTSLQHRSAAMALSSFGYASLRSDKLADWAEYGPKFLGLQLVERTGSALRFRMDDRKQRIVVSSEETAENVFGWEVHDAAALDALAGRLEAAKVAVKARAGGDFEPAGRARCDPLPRSSRQRAGGVPRGGDCRRALCTGPVYLGLQNRHAGHGPRGAAREERRGPALVLSGRAGLPAERLHPVAVQGLFLPPQPAASQPGDDRDWHKRHSSHHDGAVQPGRRGPGL